MMRPLPPLAMALVLSTLIGRESLCLSVTVTLASLDQTARKVRSTDSLPLLSLTLLMSLCLFVSVMCPKGDDPITENQQKYILKLVLESDDAISGDLILHFQDDHILLPISSAFTDSICESAFLSSRKITDVTCLVHIISSKLLSLRVTVNSWPLFPQQNNIYTHDGMPAITDFTCDTSKMSAPLDCTFTPVFTSNVEGLSFRLLYSHSDSLKSLMDEQSMTTVAIVEFVTLVLGIVFASLDSAVLLVTIGSIHLSTNQESMAKSTVRSA
jgi:hypothetical protein